MLRVSYYERPVSDVVVRCPQFASNDISITTGQISTKADGIVLWRSSIKIAQIILLLCTKWPPELKIKNPLNDISSLASGPISKIISQKCSLGDPLPKLLKWFRSAEQNGHQS